MNPPIKRRRMSSAVPLVLVGSAILAACGSNQDQTEDLVTIRDQYQSLEDCQKEWGTGSACEGSPGSQLAGNIDQNATTASNTGSSYTSGSHYTGSTHIYHPYFYGPGYPQGQRETVQRSMGLQASNSSSRATGRSVTSISRGGVGSTAHGHSGGG